MSVRRNPYLVDLGDFDTELFGMNALSYGVHKANDGLGSV